MNYTALKSLIDDPSLSGKSDSEVRDALNQRTETTRITAKVTKTTVYGTIGFASGLRLVGALKQLAASSDPATSFQFSEILDLLKVEGDGIDISLDDARAVVDQLVVNNILAAGDAAKIKALGETKVSKASLIGFNPVEIPHIETARNNLF